MPGRYLLDKSETQPVYCSVMTKAWAVAVAALLATAPWAAAAAGLPDEPFLYQTRNVDLLELASSPYRTFILDPSRDGTSAGDWTAAEIDGLQAAGKIALAVVRVAEAETARFYWDPAWVDPEQPEQHPAWLGPEVEDRPGVHRVRYWDAGWQAVLQSQIDRILLQGFDGIVVDSVDAYLYWGPEGKLPSAERNLQAREDMLALVAQGINYIRSVSGFPDYLIVPQNGAELVADDGYLAPISGLLAEHTWFAGDKRQKSRTTRLVVPYLDRVRAAGKPVLAVDYPTTARNVDLFYDRAESKGYLPLVTSADRDALTLQERHPPGTLVPAAPASPDHNADAYAAVIPTFTWSSGGQDTVTYRISFTGSEARQKVFTFPKTGVLKGTTFTPTASEWRSIQRRARDNFAGRIEWWVTTREPSGVLRSSTARTLNRMHSDVATTIFWVGAEAGATMELGREQSAWDSDWVAHFGGIDDPQNRNPLEPFWPADFVPLENPFYVALPYDDFRLPGLRRPNFDQIVPWARFRDYAPLESAVKNRWVKITHGSQTCYAQWQDVGPFERNDFRYVFGTNKPRNKKNLNAGIEVSPAVRTCLGLGSIAASSWRFVFDDETLPPGPWSVIVTTSQITP